MHWTLQILQPLTNLTLTKLSHTWFIVLKCFPQAKMMIFHPAVPPQFCVHFFFFFFFLGGGGFFFLKLFFFYYKLCFFFFPFFFSACGGLNLRLLAAAIYNRIYYLQVNLFSKVTSVVKLSFTQLLCFPG